jgi:F-type H+-transporting ATPase subunit gamma
MTLKEIKNRAKSVKNISKITNAMQMVAASKMRKAQKRTEEYTPYGEKIAEITRELTSGVDKSDHKLLLTGNPAGKDLLILISTDKGLCGALNSNLFRQINKWYPELGEKECITVGKKGAGFIRLSKTGLSADFSGKPPTDSVSALGAYAVEGFLTGKYSSITLIFNRFISSFEQKPTRLKVLPIEKIEAEETENISSDFLIEPSTKAVLEALLPEYIENLIRDAALSAEASEFSARMIAMKNATENANNLESDLTLEYNKLRQMEVTSSIQDIVTARMAIE